MERTIRTYDATEVDENVCDNHEHEQIMIIVSTKHYVEISMRRTIKCMNYDMLHFSVVNLERFIIFLCATSVQK